MAWYSAKVPGFFIKMFSQYHWHGDRNKAIVYLTFDDGPNPSITPWVLDKLKEHNAKATFFCLGKNVEQNSSLFSRIIAEGHVIGNHTHNHLSGWKTRFNNYLKDIELASKFIDSKLFRAPYGQISYKQTKSIQKKYKIVMWDVISGDFDQKNSSVDCTNNVLDNIQNGSIVVLHDSQKAKDNLKGSLDKIIIGIQEKGYQFGTIEG